MSHEIDNDSKIGTAAEWFVDIDAERLDSATEAEFEDWLASDAENERALEHSEKMHPLGRIGEPDDVASAITWLLDPANSWVTGQVIGVDGGLSTLRPAPRA